MICVQQTNNKTSNIKKTKTILDLSNVFLGVFFPNNTTFLRLLKTGAAKRNVPANPVHASSSVYEQCE